MAALLTDSSSRPLCSAPAVSVFRCLATRQTGMADTSLAAALLMPWCEDIRAFFVGMICSSGSSQWTGHRCHLTPQPHVHVLAHSLVRQLPHHIILKPQATPGLRSWIRDASLCAPQFGQEMCLACQVTLFPCSATELSSASCNGRSAALVLRRSLRLTTASSSSSWNS